jgi:hypothetical protein
MALMKLKKGAVHVLEDGTVLDDQQEVELTDDQIRMIGDTFEDPSAYVERMKRAQDRREEDDRIAQEEAEKRQVEEERLQKDLIERTQGQNLKRDQERQEGQEEDNRTEQERAAAAERGEQVNPIRQNQ